MINSWYGRLPEHWQAVPLKAVARLGTGHTPDRTQPELWTDCTIPWVTAADLSGRATEFEPLHGTQQHVSELGVQHSAAVVHPADTVMFCRTASVGLLTITGRPMATNQAFVTWTAGPRLIPRFLLYCIAAMRPALFGIAHGSTHLTIYMPDLEALRIPLPPTEEQQRIADFLDDQVARLDVAIGVSGVRQKLLLERFRSHLAQEVLKPRPSSTRTKLRYLFDHERNGIWGAEPDGGPDDITCVRVADFDRERFSAGNARTMRKVPQQQRIPRMLRRGDVLLEKSGGTTDKPVGCAVTYESDAPAVCSNFVAALRPRAEVDARFAGLVMAALYQTRQNSPFVTQTTGIQNLNSGAYLSLPVWLPDRPEQRQIAGSLDERSRCTQDALANTFAMSSLLSERKQALVTAAVTGQLDVTTARAVGVA